MHHEICPFDDTAKYVVEYGHSGFQEMDDSMLSQNALLHDYRKICRNLNVHSNEIKLMDGEPTSWAD